jgi:hypothetical protein
MEKDIEDEFEEPSTDYLRGIQDCVTYLRLILSKHGEKAIENALANVEGSVIELLDDRFHVALLMSEFEKVNFVDDPIGEKTGE